MPPCVGVATGVATAAPVDVAVGAGGFGVGVDVGGIGVVVGEAGAGVVGWVVPDAMYDGPAATSSKAMSSVRPLVFSPI